jgi:hypothetical protein
LPTTAVGDFRCAENHRDKRGSLSRRRRYEYV